MTDGEHCTHGGPKCWERECGRYKKISPMKKVREGKEGQLWVGSILASLTARILDI